MKKAMVAVLVFLSQTAFAQFLDGNHLKRISEAGERTTQQNATDKDYQESARFVGYVEGVFDANLGFLCAPQSFTAGQLAAIVTNYLKDNPGKWHLPADKLVVLAVRGAFPCKK